MSDAPDFEAITQVQQGIWSKGDFAMVASLVFNASESLAEALEIVPDERVLDVACGSGNGAISAARRSWGGTIGADYVPALLERGRERAEAERLEVEFVEADAQDLPFGEASFDVTMSIFGAMFAPDQPKTAAELLRVTKPGGRIGMANWTPEGAVGQMFKTISQHAPPPAESRIAAALGRRGPGPRAIRRRRLRDPLRASYLAPTVPLRRPLHRVLPHLFRSHPDRLRTGRPGGRGSADERSALLPAGS